MQHKTLFIMRYFGLFIKFVLEQKPKRKLMKKKMINKQIFTENVKETIQNGARNTLRGRALDRARN